MSTYIPQNNNMKQNFSQKTSFSTLGPQPSNKQLNIISNVNQVQQQKFFHPTKQLTSYPNKNNQVSYSSKVPLKSQGSFIKAKAVQQSLRNNNVISMNQLNQQNAGAIGLHMF